MSDTFEDAIAIFQSDLSVLRYAKQLYGIFLEKTYLNCESLQNMPEIAMFVAEGVEDLYDLRGIKIQNLGLTFSRLISSSKVPIEILMNKVLQFIRIVPIDQKNRRQIENYINQVQRSVNLARLFENCFKRMNFIKNSSIRRTSYIQIFGDLAWILFVNCRQHQFQTDNVTHEVDLGIMASVFYFMVKYSLQFLQPHILQKQLNNCSSKREIIAKIMHVLLAVFQIQDIDLFRKISQKFDQYAENLLNNRILRTVTSDTDFLSPFIIHLNLNQLNKQYQKNLQLNKIDMGLFRQQKVSLSPLHKDALYSRRLIDNDNEEQKVYQSHRVLDFEESLQEFSNQNQVTIINTLKAVSQNIPPFSLSNWSSLQHEMYRYFKNISKFSQHDAQQVNAGMIVEIISADPIIAPQAFQRVLLRMHKLFSEKLAYVAERSSVFDESVQIICNMIICAMKNQEKQNIDDLISLLASKSTEHQIICWCFLTQLHKNDPYLPPFLRSLFLNQERYIISELIWKNNIFIDQIAELAANYAKPEYYVTFVTGIFVYLQNFLAKIKKQLEISLHVCKCAYNCMKFLLCSNGNILEGRNIDQILLCALYISGKAQDEPLLFTKIKEAYEKNEKNESKHQMVFRGFNKNNESVDIIKFYNCHFIASIEPFVPYMKNPSLSLLHPAFQRQLKSVNDRIVLEESVQNINNFLQTQKTKHSSKKYEDKNEQRPQFQIRNETRVRTRPNYGQNQPDICSTYKINKYLTN